MESKTTEFSFILKASDHGVGVFVVHGIKAETFLRVFGDENNPSDVSIVRKKEDVPEFFRQYCVDRGDVMGCHKDFGCMEIPSAHVRDREYYALRDILAGEEITIDYNSLNEPEETKKDYYKK